MLSRGCVARSRYGPSPFPEIQKQIDLTPIYHDLFHELIIAAHDPTLGLVTTITGMDPRGLSISPFHHWWTDNGQPPENLSFRHVLLQTLMAECDLLKQAQYSSLAIIVDYASKISIADFTYFLDRESSGAACLLVSNVNGDKD